MKKRIVIVNAGLMIAVLFSILIQSWHSYTHLAKQISEKECLHEYKSSKEITHQHEAFENCFVCAFTLSSFIAQDFIAPEFKRTADDRIIPVIALSAVSTFFKGSLFSLRAPPVV